MRIVCARRRVLLSFVNNVKIILYYSFVWIQIGDSVRSSLRFDCDSNIRYYDRILLRNYVKTLLFALDIKMIRFVE